MKLKLRLVQDGRTLIEIPLSPSDWSKKDLKEELGETEESFHTLSKIFDALSHETRLRMMGRLIGSRDQTLSFADFMQDLDLNPKIVWENSRKLEEGGLLEKTGRGKYVCSEFGQTFVMMSLALRRLIESLTNEEEL
jgi:Mn-dependent DtxR family transcriptional regulator